MGVSCLAAGVAIGLSTGPFVVLTGAVVGAACLGGTLVASSVIEDKCKDNCLIPEPTIGSATLPPVAPGKRRGASATPGSTVRAACPMVAPCTAAVSLRMTTRYPRSTYSVGYVLRVFLLGFMPDLAGHTNTESLLYLSFVLKPSHVLRSRKVLLDEAPHRQNS